MRTIKKIHIAEYRPIADLETYSPMPTHNLPHIDPFLFLNHHGFQTYPPNNNGLPFGPHPHRGIETVTFIVDGDIAHEDNNGYKSVINGGGIQWMTAGKGLIHAETSSEEFLENGGDLEILQLWVNLPAKYKMTEPNYTGLQEEGIPHIKSDDGKVRIKAISGNWNGEKGAFDSLTDVYLSSLEFKAGGKISFEVEAERNILFYVVRGKVSVNGKEVSMRHLVEFTNDGKNIDIEATEDSLIIFGHALPYNEPIVAHGPFVMNSMEEIQQAYLDYQNGKFGIWKG
ncbi:pirin family protein [Limibacter armeniacum]|uniref:pirin family protein n=1 Tax=Limibacter armeniacum TaxID=466084 RepID=UPI002FE5F4D2